MLEGGQYSGISVVTPLDLSPGAIVAVALSGVRLRDGRMATHVLVRNACNMGLLLEEVQDPVGSDLTARYT